MGKTSQPFQVRKSNRAAGQEAAERVRLLIDKCAGQGGILPVKNGALWHAEIKRQANLSNGQIDGNSEIKAMLQAHADLHRVQYSRRGRVAPEEDTPREVVNATLMVPIERLRDAQMRLSAAERKNAELRAENARLRSQLMRGDEVAELIALGGRIEPGELDL